MVSLTGDPSDQLANAAAELDVMVVGSRGYGPMRHALLGSVSAKLMRNCPAPLLVVPRGARHEGETVQLMRDVIELRPPRR